MRISGHEKIVAQDLWQWALWVVTQTSHDRVRVINIEQHLLKHQPYCTTMDKFVTVLKPARSSLKEKEKCTNSSRFTPYPTSKPKIDIFPNEMSKSNYPEAVAQDKARLRQYVSVKYSCIFTDSSTR